MNPLTRRVVLTLLFLMGLAWAAVAEWIGSGGDLGEDAGPVLMDVLPWLLYQWVGLAAMSRSRSAREGSLLYLVGLALPLPTLSQSMEPSIYWGAVLLTGVGFWGVSRVLLQHAVLAFPTGRLPGRAERAFLAISYATVVLTQLLVVVSADTGTYLAGTPPGIPPLPRNPLLIISDEQLYYRLNDVHIVAGAVLAAVFIVLVARRWWLSSSAMRRTIGPVSLAAVAAALLFFLSLLLMLIAEGRPSVWQLRNQVFGFEAFFTALIPFAVLAGLVRNRLDRAEVADMLVRLEEGGSGEHLRQVLAEAVGDPGLLLARETATGGLEDMSGRSTSMPGPGGRRMASPVESVSGAHIWLIHDTALQENPELLRSAIAAARLTLENERLEAAARGQLAEVRASRARIVEASDAERRRMERDLHDGAQQRLVSVALQLQVLRERAAASAPEMSGLVEATATQLEEAIAELRELARGIHPAILGQSGLRAAIESIVLHTPLAVSMDVPEIRFAPTVEAAAYFVVAEGLTNVVRHAHASTARVEVRQENVLLDLSVADDGCGGADSDRGSGLRGLADRLAVLGGSLDVQSPPGLGTRLHAVIPCE